MIGRSHRSHAIAQTHVGMTWLLDPTSPRYAMSGFHIEKGGFQYAAAIDARRRTCPCWHDMAAGASPRDDLLPKMLQQPSQITCPISPIPSC